MRSDSKAKLQTTSGAISHVLAPISASASGGRSGAFCSAVFLSLFFVVYGTISLFAEPLVAYADTLGPPFNSTWEDASKRLTKASDLKFPNPLYEEDRSFRALRRFALAGLTLREADFARRITAAVFLGALVGLERRAPNRAAGVRTMALVSLGACIFTIASAFDFEDGSQEWDASRISAALPSGVGFLGGAVIFKHGGGDAKPELVGLTTACGIWLSCAIGTCCGGAMYFPACFGTACMVTTLRFGPRRPTEEGEVDCLEAFDTVHTRPADKNSLTEPLVGSAPGSIRGHSASEEVEAPKEGMESEDVKTTRSRGKSQLSLACHE